MKNSASDRFIHGHLNMKQLVLLNELGRHSSIVHASRAAHLSQPNATRLIAGLEHALGVPLFERSARGVKPTPAGSALIRRAGAVLEEMKLAHREISQSLAGYQGRVAIGSVLSPATNVLSGAVRAFKARHDRTHLAIEVGISADLVERLQTGRLDIVVGRITDTHDRPALNFDYLCDEDCQVVVRAGHPLCERRKLSLRELMELPWILPPPGSVFRERLASRLLSERIVSPGNTIETQDLPFILSLVASSDTAVALPSVVARKLIAAGELSALPFDLDLQLGVCGIITRRGDRPTFLAGEMVQCLKDAARPGHFPAGGVTP